MKIILFKVISGGQTGIDELGLSLAKLHGISTGGFMPPGFMTEEGPKPEFKELYDLEELDSGMWSKRTRYNVKSSDGTVIFGNIASKGTASTINFLNKFKKPYCINPNGIEMIEFVISNQIGVLNIAGNKESILSMEYRNLARESLITLFKQL